MTERIGLHPLSSEERDALIAAWSEPSPEAVLLAVQVLLFDHREDAVVQHEMSEKREGRHG